jgi:subtilisin family serine protease
MANLLGSELRKFHPKLRMIADGSAEVNTVRAEQCASLSIEKPGLIDSIPILRGAEPMALALHDLPSPPKTPRLEQLAQGVLVNVFVETQDIGEDLPDVCKGRARRGNLVATTVSLSELPDLAAHPRVMQIEPGEPLAAPTPEISREKKLDPPDATRWRYGPARKHHDGAGVLIGIVDVQGFDFAHPDFLDGGKTRFVRIWDQGGNVRPSPHVQDKVRYGTPFDFGAEFRKEHLDRAIASSGNVKLPAQEIERQSQMARSSHGTHVASIAAGNLGLCRRAMIAGVLISLPEEDEDRRKSFYDSTRIAHAIDYLLLLADELSAERGAPVPVSINISLGTNGHAHDGTAAVSRWIDSAMAVPGRCVTVAAGNAGQERATSQDDIGYVMGRIHTAGRVPGRYQHVDIRWAVVGNSKVDVSENELEIWYSEQDRFAVSVRPPGKDSDGKFFDWIGPIKPRQFIQNRQLPGGSMLSIYNELYHPSNGNNYIAIYLSPFFGRDAVVGVPAGEWTVRIHGLDVRDGAFHGWIERDDPRRIGRIGPKEAWRFPSFFTEPSNVDDSSVGSLACGRRVISVANLNESEERVHITSSQGPTRDNRFKPDVAAPGTDIVAANGFADRQAPWVRMTGTSMASPFVTGVVGLMLATEPRLTAAQIEGIIHRTSRPLPGSAFKWTNDAGFGRIDPEACLGEAASVNDREEVGK